MLSTESRIHAFSQLGFIMGQAADCLYSDNEEFQTEFPGLYKAMQDAIQHNRWFTPANISFALQAWSIALNEDSLRLWVEQYSNEFNKRKPARIAVIMAGNIPIVGFHDFLCVLISGHNLIGKLSSDDKILMPALSDILCSIEPGFKSCIQFNESTLHDFDAIIATGSNNTARYFEYYFSRYPHIIRKSRNGVAILAGNETEIELVKLGTDICSFFGLGCRNVSKIFIPAGFEPKKIYKATEMYNEVLTAHNKYMNNYSYQRSILLLNNVSHLDNGIIILKESTQYSSPIATLHYEFYDNLEILRHKLDTDKDMIQCIVNELYNGTNTVKFGNSQYPGLSDYADGIDTMKFINEQ